jgi:hypothetical protein
MNTVSASFVLVVQMDETEAIEQYHKFEKTVKKNTKYSKISFHYTYCQ